VLGVVRNTSRSAGRSSASVVITHRGTVIDTAAAPHGDRELQPTQSVSTKPVSGVSTTMLGRNRCGWNRVAGASSDRRRRAGRLGAPRRSRRTCPGFAELAAVDQLLALDGASAARVGVGAVLESRQARRTGIRRRRRRDVPGTAQERR
jgi:hypothetical protein